MAPSSSRSSSISSSSTSSSKCSDIKKKFCCSFPSCGKSFSRSEHLHRHALNHKEGNNTCLRCSAHFRRRDLLDRHMARHKEKDDEAGGEGLGVLATRKRLWRDANGNIVNARRPSCTQEGAKRRQTNRVEKKARVSPVERKMTTRGQTLLNALPSPTIPMSRNGSTTSSTIVVDTTKFEYPDPEEAQKMKEDSWLEMGALPSPPTSESSLNSAAQSPSADLSDLSDLDGLYEEASWPLHDGLPQIEESNPELERSEFVTPSWSSQPQPFQTFMGAMAELPYDDIFKPESGMYDWQHWNSQVLMSRCREEKYDPLEERKLEWGSSYPGQDVSYRRTFGLGTC